MAKDIKELDLIIIGGGPAGLTAAIYAGRAKLDTLLLENMILGGQVRNSYTIENYPGFKSIEGGKLADLIQEQAAECGAVIDEFDLIQNIYLSDEEKTHQEIEFGIIGIEYLVILLNSIELIFFKEI